MAAKTIDQLPAVDLLAGDETLPIQSATGTGKVTADALAARAFQLKAFTDAIAPLLTADTNAALSFSNYIAARQVVDNQVQATLQTQAQTLQTQQATIASLNTDIGSLKAIVLPNGAGALTLTAPTISGTNTVGSTITFGSGTIGNGTAVTSTYTVKRGSVIVAGPQTGNSYILVAADGGTTLTVTQTVANAAGQMTAATSVGFAVSAAPAVPSVITPPTISGTAADGQTLTGVHGTYTNGPIVSYTYQWKNNTTVLGTAQTLVITTAMVGLSITFSEIPSNATGAAVAASTSASVIVSGGATPANITPPGWSAASDFTVGGVLRFDPGLWTNNPDPALDVWGILRDAVAISTAINAANPTYTAVAADQDKTLTPTLIRRNSGSSPSALAQGAGEYIAATTGGTTPSSAFGTLTATTFSTSTAGPNGYMLTPTLAGVVTRAGGYNIAYAPLGGTLANDASVVTPTINYTGGTPTASGSTATGLLTQWGVQGSGIQFTIDIPAGSSTVYVPVIAYGVVDTVTATLADGSAPAATFIVDPGAAGVDTKKLVAIPVTAGAATQMIVKVEQSTFYTANQGNSHLCGIWV